jgi:hypothetical protein
VPYLSMSGAASCERFLYLGDLYSCFFILEHLLLINLFQQNLLMFFL